MRQFAVVMGKHEFELEKRPVKTLVVIGRRSLKFDDVFKGVQCVRLPMGQDEEQD